MSTTSRQSKLHQRVHPPHAAVKASADQLILQAIVANTDEMTLRTRLSQIGLSLKGAAGVCFLNKNVDDTWTIATQRPKSGRLPESAAIAQNLSEKCDLIAQSHNIKVEAIDDSKLFCLMAPVRTRSAQPEIMMLVLSGQRDAILATATMQKVSGGLSLWLDNKGAADSDWQVLALAAVIELVSKVEKQTTLKSASEETANLLANRLGCSSVAVGLIKHRRMKLQAVSGIAKLDSGSETSRNYLQVMVESAARKEAGVYPASDAENNHLLQAHKQLAARSHVDAVYSHPLITEDDELFGALVFTGPRQLIDSDQVQRFGDAAAPAITGALQVVSKVKRNPVSRSISYVAKKLSALKQLFILLVIAGFVALMFVPITYRVRCNCIAEPVLRRFAAAPFSGQIVLGHVEAGDYVKAGDVLAEMDGRTVNWELAGITAEKRQSVRTREIELADHNVAKTLLSELEHQRLVSEEAILKYKKKHLQITSKIDGVVLSGSLERAEAASVETGQTLFEIGPLKPLRIEIAIPDDEISQVKAGFPVKVWIDGQEDEPIEGEIQRIHPRSETRDADNVFIADVEFPNDDERLRPGMKGSARIDCEQRSLGWSLFHKPVNWVRSRLTWW